MTPDDELLMREYLDFLFRDEPIYEIIVSEMKNYRRNLKNEIRDRKDRDGEKKN